MNSIDGLIFFNLSKVELRELMGEDKEKSKYLWECMIFKRNIN